jgi:hypothetical protein
VDGAAGEAEGEAGVAGKGGGVAGADGGEAREGEAVVGGPGHWGKGNGGGCLLGGGGGEGWRAGLAGIDGQEGGDEVGVDL